MVKGGKELTFSAENCLRTFHRAANSILYRKNGPNANVLMKLLYTNCVPILTYACAVKEFNHCEMTSCNNSINNAIRKIFGFATFESVRHLRKQHNCRSIFEIFGSAKNSFVKAAKESSNTVIRHLVTNCLE